MRDQTFMTSTQKGGKKFFADSIVFKQKIYCSFLQMGGAGVRGSKN